MRTAVRNSEHLAEDCNDDSCPRFPCRMYHAGYEAGYRSGFADGWGDGEAAGFSAGYAAGAASTVAR
jgi:hypothetical protein